MTTNEILQKMDSNNTKAMAIMDSMVALMDTQHEGVDFTSLAEAANAFLHMNMGLFDTLTAMEEGNDDVQFDYTMLTDAIKAAGGVSAVAKGVGMTAVALKKTLKNEREFDTEEMDSLSAFLNIPASETETYFFSVA